MSNSRRALIHNIEETQQQLQREASAVVQHQQTLFHIMHDPRLVLVAGLLPAFTWGWQMAREKRLSKMFRFLEKK